MGDVSNAPTIQTHIHLYQFLGYYCVVCLAWATADELNPPASDTVCCAGLPMVQAQVSHISLNQDIAGA
jgi:hypothetical protein